MIVIRIEGYQVPQSNTFIQRYIDDFQQVRDYFDYSPNGQDSFRHKMESVHQRYYDRHQLADTIESFHAQFGADSNLNEQLDKLRDPKSLVVISGQQAGVFLGPLFTLYKLITIVHLAKQQEDALSVPVVPVFWIAGEDHDFLEINHIHIPRQNGSGTQKWSVDSDSWQTRQSVSHRKIPHEKLRHWFLDVMEQFPHTEYSAALTDQVLANINASLTYVDFFAKTMHDICKAYGVLMIDSAHPSLRQLQLPHFETIIDQYDHIYACVQEKAQQMVQDGYTPQLNTDGNPSLLFLYENNERQLLEKRGDVFITKGTSNQYTKDELLRIVRHDPSRISSNVISRPFLQEAVFPTLAYVGGPGEIGYWALFRSYFHILDMHMPVLVPRLSMTLVEAPIRRIMEKRSISYDDVFTNFNAFRNRWLDKQKDEDLDAQFEQVRYQITETYEVLIDRLGAVEPGLEQLGSKNLEKIMDQVQYLEKRANHAFTKQHEAALRQFNRVEQALIPNGSLQERVYTPLMFINKHGWEWMKQLMDHEWEIDGKHWLVEL